MTVEWAKDSDAEAIRSLLAADGVVFEGGDWAGLGRTWLVFRDGGIKACLAYHPGRPLARLDFLSIDPGITGLSRVRLVRDILEAAFAVCALHGSSFVAGVVPYYLPEYGEFLARRNGKSINEGWLYCTSVTDVLVERDRINGRRKQNNDKHDGHPDPGRDRIH